MTVADLSKLRSIITDLMKETTVLISYPSLCRWFNYSEIQATAAAHKVCNSPVSVWDYPLKSREQTDFGTYRLLGSLYQSVCKSRRWVTGPCVGLKAKILSRWHHSSSLCVLTVSSLKMDRFWNCNLVLLSLTRIASQFHSIHASFHSRPAWINSWKKN